MEKRKKPSTAKRGRIKGGPIARLPVSPSGSREFEGLFDRVAMILDEARGAVVRSVNNEMVLAYWLIGQAIVETMQRGDARATYGRQLIAELSGRLTKRYGPGFSTTNLWYFRQFYQVFTDRKPVILHKPCGESTSSRSGAQRRVADQVRLDLSLAVEPGNRPLLRPEREQAGLRRKVPEVPADRIRVETRDRTRTAADRCAPRRRGETLMPSGRPRKNATGAGITAAVVCEVRR